MPQTIPLTDIRDQLSELVNQVAYGNSQVILTKFGKPKAAIINYQDYQQFMNPATRFSPQDWNNGFQIFSKVKSKTRKLNQKQLQQAINQSIKEVRQNSDSSSN